MTVSHCPLPLRHETRQLSLVCLIGPCAYRLWPLCLHVCLPAPAAVPAPVPVGCGPCAMPAIGPCAYRLRPLCLMPAIGSCPCDTPRVRSLSSSAHASMGPCLSPLLRLIGPCLSPPRCGGRQAWTRSHVTPHASSCRKRPAWKASHVDSVGRLAWREASVETLARRPGCAIGGRVQSGGGKCTARHW